MTTPAQVAMVVARAYRRQDLQDAICGTPQDRWDYVVARMWPETLEKIRVYYSSRYSCEYSYDSKLSLTAHWYGKLCAISDGIEISKI